MKRWWNLPQQRPVAGARRRVGRVMGPAMMAGAVCLALPLATLGQCTNSSAGTSDSQVAEPHNCVRLPRTGGAAVEAWAIGTVSEAKQTNSEACDLDHVCALAISSAGGAGTGLGTTIKTSPQTSSQADPSPNLPFTLTETIYYARSVRRGGQGGNSTGGCYPASGVMTIAVNGSSNLVLDIMGQACQVGSDTARLVFTGSYVTDTASSGTVANADGIDSINMNSPSGLPGTSTSNTDLNWLKVSLTGQLMYGQ